MTNCISCETDLLEGEMFYCDPCRMSAVYAKLFSEIIRNEMERN